MKTFAEILNEGKDEIKTGIYVWPKDRDGGFGGGEKWSPTNMWIIYDVKDSKVTLSNTHTGKKRKISKKQLWAKYETKK